MSVGIDVGSSVGINDGWNVGWNVLSWEKHASVLESKRNSTIKISKV
jgi:hypothetical protein